MLSKLKALFVGMASSAANRQKTNCQKCHGSTSKNDGGETILKCSSCGSSYHAKKCLKYSDRLISLASTYNWMCGSCKQCELCLRKRNEKHLILCDDCDRGYHIFCLVPQLWKPPPGSWRCPNCAASTKENVDGTGSSKMTRTLRRSRHASDQGSSVAARCSSALPDVSTEPKRKRKRESSLCSTTTTTYSTRRSAPISKASTSGACSAPPPKIRRSRTSSPSVKKATKIKNRALGIGRNVKKPDTCPVPGCNSEGHLSGRYPRHVYREFCPQYHGVSQEETKDLRKKRLELMEQHKTPKRGNNSGMQAIMKSVDDERTKTEAYFRKQRQASTSSAAGLDNSVAAILEHAEEKEPPLADYVTKFDLDLFRMAQGQLAEDMEREPNLRNPTSTRVKWLRFGRYEIGTWYPSQFPGEFGRLDKVFMCEYCLKFMRSEYQLKRHGLPGHCAMTHPPGEKIYEKGNLAVWEIDGKREKIYCQNLCLLAMLFLDHKTLFKDVEAFYFYILTVVDEEMEDTYHMVAYFSKEKTSSANCNLSCLLTLPPFLRRGYGHFLIDMSYALSRIENRIGSPEHPLSDMGLKAYRSYWKFKIFDYIGGMNTGDTISVKDISHHTGIHQNDLISTLQYLGMVKYWRGQYWILKKDSIQAHMKKQPKKKHDPLQAPREIDMSCLNWARVQQQQ